MREVFRRLYELAFERSSLIALSLVPILFAAVRLSLVPVVWPELPPENCFEPVEGCGLMFDEAHYVPAVRRIMLGEAVNLEHPPLSKWILMAGMALFGDNPWGWRSLNVLFSAFTVFFVGLLAYRLARELWAATFSQLLLALDVTFFNISGMAVLDPPALTFMALSLLLLAYGRRALAGVAAGLSMLSKASGLIALLALMAVEAAYPVVRGAPVDEVFKAVKGGVRLLVIPALLVFLTGLGVFDIQTGVFPTPLHHLQFILDYHSGLGFDDPLHVELPLTWLMPPITRQPAPYYVVTVEPPGWHPIAFWGVSSPLWWSTWLLAPAAYVYLRERRGGVGNPSPDLILLAWAATTLGAFAVLGYLARRWMYSFYFLQVAVGLAPAAPMILRRSGGELLPKLLLASQAVWMFMWFPVKPDWLLELLSWLGLGEVPWV